MLTYASKSIEKSVPIYYSESEVDAYVPSETTLPHDGEPGHLDVEIAQGSLQENSAIAVDVGGRLASDNDLEHAGSSATLERVVDTLPSQELEKKNLVCAGFTCS